MNLTTLFLLERNIGIVQDISFDKFSPFEYGTATTPNTSLTRTLSGLLYHHHQHIGCSMNKMEQHQKSKFHCCPCGKLLVMILFQQWWYKLHWTKVQARPVKTEIYGKTMNAKNFWCPPCLHNHDYFITLWYMSNQRKLKQPLTSI